MSAGAVTSLGAPRIDPAIAPAPAPQRVRQPMRLIIDASSCRTRQTAGSDNGAYVRARPVMPDVRPATAPGRPPVRNDPDPGSESSYRPKTRQDGPRWERRGGILTARSAR